MICNYVGKIIPALQSRCTKFRFAPLKTEQVRGRVDEVIAAEGIDITPDGVDSLLELGASSPREGTEPPTAAHTPWLPARFASAPPFSARTPRTLPSPSPPSRTSAAVASASRRVSGVVAAVSRRRVLVSIWCRSVEGDSA